MTALPLSSPHQRFALSGRLRDLAADIAEDVTDAFLERHPDWVARYGDRARTAGEDDARFHVQFLSAAVESGEPAAFVEYARWTARVLQSRGIASTFLAENLQQVHSAIHERLGDEPLVNACVTAALDALAEGVSVPSTVPSGPSGGADGALTGPAPDDAVASLAQDCRMYVQAALAGERRAALNVTLEALRGGASPLDLYVGVLQAAQYEIGRLWETNRITVAHEHAATAITQFVMAQLYERLDRGATVRGNLVITGIEGEYHNIGALMVSDILELHGWNVRFLGTNLPRKAIVDVVVEHEAAYLGISVTMLYNVQAARRLITDVRTRCGDTVKVVVGGGAFRHAPNLWQDIGADGHGGDVQSALEVLGT